MFEEHSQPINATGVKACIIVSSYHSEITNELAKAARDCFIEAGGSKEDCLLLPAPGAWELPLIAKEAARNLKVDVVVALGCVLTGETTHDRVIADAIAKGLMDVSINEGKPVSMGVLTCQTIEQAQTRSGGDKGNKGEEAMYAALASHETIQSTRTS